MTPAPARLAAPDAMRGLTPAVIDVLMAEPVADYALEWDRSFVGPASPPDAWAAIRRLSSMRTAKR